MIFYLGTHRPGWLGTLDVPLFVSHNTLKERKTLPRALAPWALDSGGFTQLRKPPHRYTISTDDYAAAVEHYGQIGLMQWAAPMDWMCEPELIARTGLSVREHQDRTVQSYLDLRGRGPFIPVLQGWTLTDYERCVSLYGDAGVDLTEESIVGIGSVCKRQSTKEIGRIFHALYSAGIACHGFGVKKEGIELYGRYLASADSMAWSYRARRSWPLQGCTHRNCANCSRFALRWRDELLRCEAPELWIDSSPGVEAPICLA